MKILVLGGMHGNEALGVNLVRSLEKNPISGVDYLIASPKAIKAQKRFIESDLNRSFGKQEQSTYESRRAQELRRALRPYDVVLDFHNTETENNNCCFVGIGCSSVLYGVAKQLGINQCIEATYDCVNKYCLNTISIEISIGDILDSVEYWRGVIARLQTNKQENMITKLTLYRFLRRVSWNEQKKLGISTWSPFEQLTETDKIALNVKGVVAPIFIGSHLTEFYATLVTKTGEK